jgi:ribosomal protein L11 methyltransferase
VSLFEDGREWRVDAYYRDREAAHSALVGLRAILPAHSACVRLQAVPDENWVAISQAALPPVHAGRFTIAGDHDRHRVAQGPNTLIIDAGEAFGTAHHATTYGCLVALDRLTRAKRYENVLDLGTGSGILALALKRVLPGASVLASDIDQRSIEVARENAQRNGLGVRAGGPRFIRSEGVRGSAIRAVAPFDLIIANILARPLIEMAEDIVRVLGPSGTVVLSGLLNHQAGQVKMRYVGLGLTVERHDRHAGWSTLVLTDGDRRARGTGGFSLYIPAYE